MKYTNAAHILNTALLGAFLMQFYRILLYSMITAMKQKNKTVFSITFSSKGTLVY